MMTLYSKHFDLTTAAPKNLLDDSAASAVWLKKEIDQSGALEKLILDYEYGKGKIQNVSIIPDTIMFTEKGRGRFKAGYDINEYSLCAAIDYIGENKMDITFDIDDKKNQLFLSGENRIERVDEL
ncbi:hypothetical protein [Pedobacter metabolipauper]|uniref:Uncharacterized protein n=1 Tax=Pedobacter metabolipauper TaxID=425513 RepID=A0A4R6T240_9SPHI|nr:hypothetical protein [Pedobacter metabolipauper]TDQ11391.1 hypothetical protein ATK78_0509 [Pedobacter metabolipauper]